MLKVAEVWKSSTYSQTLRKKGCRPWTPGRDFPPAASGRLKVETPEVPGGPSGPRFL